MNETKRLVYSKNFDPIPPVLKRPAAIPAELCDKIVASMRRKGLQPGQVWDGQQYVIDEGYRVVDTADILEADCPELYDHLQVMTEAFNERFKFSIHGVFDDAIFMEYRQSDNGQKDSFFNWHVDMGEGYTSLRKFSIVIALNDHDEYEGGDLHIRNGTSKDSIIRLRKGDAVAFPAYISHCVTPVTHGVRNSIVVFIVGPRFI